LRKAAGPAAQRCEGHATHHSFGATTGFTEFDWKTGFQSRPAAGQPGAAAPRQAPVQRTLQVSLFEAAFGCVKRVSGTVTGTCQRCAGSGEFSGSWTLGTQCLQCHGRGQVGQSGALRACSACQGQGLLKPPPPRCTTCKGTGHAERRSWMADVHIHAGTLDGAEVQASDIRLRTSLAEAPRRIRLQVQLEKHPLFKLEIDRLSVSVPISFWRWSLGGEITVPTLEGSTRVRLAAKPTAILVKNEGWPEAKTALRRRPMYVLPRMVYPQDLGAHERELLQMLDTRGPMPEVEGWTRHVQACVEASAASPYNGEVP
jgi:molecular chaperone DnaJ